MKSFPMFIRTTHRRVVIAGGGEQAAQKARLVQKSDAQIVIAAPALDPELLDLVQAGNAQWHSGPITSALFEGAAMGFVATGCPGTDASLHALAKSARCPVNVVDQPALCDIITPSIVDRDPIVVAIGTEGTAPVLARKLKTKIEEYLPTNVGGLAQFAGRMRAAVAMRVPREERRAFWRWVFSEAPYRAWTRGAEREAATAIKRAIEGGGAPEELSAGMISLVGAGPGARDLLTLRAVQRLQEADVIFYDRLSGEDALELARRDADRVYVGKTVGAHAWPQDRINARIIAEALRGKRVVRLKSGDPSIFGRAGEELDAAKAAGVVAEIIPGITAASAAAASANISLTQRGKSDCLILTTATSQAGDPLPEPVRQMTPGSTIAFYMAARQVQHIQAAMIAKGVPAETEFLMVVNASKPDELILKGTLLDLAKVTQENQITGSAMIVIKWEAARAPSPLRALG